jgi:hypothetical protein
MPAMAGGFNSACKGLTLSLLCVHNSCADLFLKCLLNKEIKKMQLEI